ncbi:MAG: potassium transporter TrkG [Mariprofundaceae bacterium]|nr:potassium transporter TrkG [Mariprofundaceae bacterium]
MHPRGIVWTLAMLSVLFGSSTLITAGVAIYYHTGHAIQFAACGGIVMLSGIMVVGVSRPAPSHLGHRDGFLIVTLAWILLSLLGAVPFWVTGVCHSFVDGIFESVSGLTTTGATILSGLDQMAPSILFWRSMLQWLGGIGIIVLVVAVIPFLGAGGMQLLRAEVPGPVKDKLTSRVSETAKVLWALYLGISTLCALAYWWAGMGWFDAVNHAMCTVSTGGFSTHDASFGYYGKPALHVLAVIFMFVSGVNFALHFAAMRRGVSLRLYLADDEFRFYLGGLFLLVLFIGLLVIHQGNGNSWDEVVFSAVSLATTTGFTVGDYSTWPPGPILILLLMMLVGACAGSTSGGMKAIRLLLLFRHARRELKRLVHPHGVMHVKLGDRALKSSVAQSLWGFAVLYLVSFFVIAILVALTGVDVFTSLSASAACLSNTGPGFGAVGPAHNYELLPAAAKAVLMFGMVLGRLEIYTFFVLLIPEFWRK